MLKLVLEILGPLFEQHAFLLENLDKESVDYKDFLAIKKQEMNETAVRKSLALLIKVNLYILIEILITQKTAFT